MTPIEGELRAALGDNLAAMMTSIQNGSGNYSIQLTPIDEREQSQQELMQVARRALGKYKNARISVSGGTDISGASSGGGGGGGAGRRWRRQHEPPQHDRPGARHRAAAELRADAAGEGPGDRRRHRRRHQLRGDPARAADHRRPRARGRPRRQHRHAVVDHARRWSAARKCRSSRTATSSSASAAPRRAVPQRSRARWATSSCRRPAAAWSRVSDVAHADDGQRARLDRPLQPAAADLGQRQPRSPEDHARRRARARRATRSTSSA